MEAKLSRDGHILNPTVEELRAGATIVREIRLDDSRSACSYCVVCHSPLCGAECIKRIGIYGYYENDETNHQVRLEPIADTDDEGRILNRNEEEIEAGVTHIGKKTYPSSTPVCDLCYLNKHDSHPLCAKCVIRLSYDQYYLEPKKITWNRSTKKLY